MLHPANCLSVLYCPPLHSKDTSNCVLACLAMQSKRTHLTPCIQRPNFYLGICFKCQMHSEMHNRHRLISRAAESCAAFIMHTLLDYCHPVTNSSVLFNMCQEHMCQKILIKKRGGGMIIFSCIWVHKSCRRPCIWWARKTIPSY